ncbi:MAG: hypothetical protein ACTSUW_05380 [Candidatus Heimdallarchaeota archaeon]
MRVILKTKILKETNKDVFNEQLNILITEGWTPLFETFKCGSRDNIDSFVILLSKNEIWNAKR